MLSLFVVAQLVVAQPATPANDGVAHDSIYATPALRALVAEAAERNALPADLESYEARVETEIGVLSRRPGEEEGVAAVEQVASELRWSAAGERYEQHVTGYRVQQVGLNLSILSILGTGWVTPTLYGNRVRIRSVNDSSPDAGRGRRRRGRARRHTMAFIHPLAADRERVYRYGGGDTVVRLRANGREIPIVRVHVEPRRGLAARTGVFTGDVDLDAVRRQVVRIRGQFGVVGGKRGWRDRVPGAGVQAVAYVEYVNAELQGRFWLPSYQRLELQAALPALGEGRAVIRFVSRLRGHAVNALPAGWPPATDAAGRAGRGPAALTYASRDSLTGYGAWLAELGAATAAVHADDFDDVAPDGWRPTGRPRLDVQAERSSDVFHFNRVEGAYTGLGLTLRARDAAPGLMLRVVGGWAWSEGTVRGRVQGAWERGGWVWGARAGRALDITNDFRYAFDSGSTVAALLASTDDYDYVDRRSAVLSATRLVGGRTARVRVEAGVGSDRGARARLERGLFKGDSGFRPNRGVGEGSYVRAGATWEYRPDVTAELMRPGVGALASYERGAGGLSWHRVEARVVGRRNWRRLTYAARADAGVVAGTSPPPQQLFELGQTQNLPGYDYKEFAGDQAAVVRLLAMYTTPYLGSPLRVRRRWVLPSPSPTLSAGVQAGWARASGAGARASIARLTAGILAADGRPAPLPRPTDGALASVNVGLRFFGGSVFVGAARAVDRGERWRFTWSLAQQL